MFQLFIKSSCLYFAKKWIVSSTDIPNAMENTRIVDGFNAIPKYPIIAPVRSKGIKFGIIETTTIRNELNIHAIKIEIRIITKSKLKTKFLIKNLVPFKKTIEVPVIVTSYFSGSNISLILGSKLSKILSILEVEMSATLKEILASCFKESINIFPNPKPSELFFK